MTRITLRILAIALAIAPLSLAAPADTITSAGKPAQLDVRASGDHSLRITLRPVDHPDEFPFNPALVERAWPAPAISLRELTGPVEKQVGKFNVSVKREPQLTVAVADLQGRLIQNIAFEPDGSVAFHLDRQPVLGMGEGGPMPRGNWREQAVEFDRAGTYQEMRPRWQSDMYGSRNPVALMVGTGGWGLFIATPWGDFDLTDENRGRLIPWQPPDPTPSPETAGATGGGAPQAEAERKRTALIQGRPPVESVVPGVVDLFVFDARDPAVFMKEVATLTGPAVIPPKWALGYMQSHRELVDKEMESEKLILSVVDTFREKKMPLDTVIYLGTGFTPTGWNTRQPSFDFNPAVFKSDPKKVIADLRARDVKVVLHMVPPHRNEGLPTLHGNIPARAAERLDASHIQSYWQRHVPLFNTPIDGWWPDEGDWFSLWERVTRHKMYYQGPLWTRPGERPWSLHRNGYLGIAQWGGWVWSGDTQATWKTLEAQIAVGLNHSLSLSPYWGSDTGGFYTTAELTGELYARWFQFSAFNPSFRSHGRIWRLRVPWGWGLSDMGFLEGQREPPNPSEMNNPAIEPACRIYADLRYQLMPYTYTLAWQARAGGMPFMRALWLHYPDDPRAAANGRDYLWGRDLLVAPVYLKGATTREVYLPRGVWYDWWTNARQEGGRTVSRAVDLNTMPIYARAGAIIPFDPVRQYTAQAVSEPTTIKVFRGADGEFTMYEDDGISLDYLQNKATWTKMTWNDSAGRLTLEPGAPAGAVNQPSRREFRVQLLPEGTVKTVTYNGTRTEVSF